MLIEAELLPRNLSLTVSFPSVYRLFKHKLPELHSLLCKKFGSGLGKIIPDPLVRCTVWLRILPSSSENSKKNLDFYCFVTSLWLFISEELCKCTFKK
jgi:hypothetical protein